MHLPCPHLLTSRCICSDRALLVNASEAETVQRIFARYLKLGSVHALQHELTAEGIVSKRRVTAAGKTVGGQPFSRGALFHLLRNRLYLGQIVHRDAVYDGEHDAIVDADLFERVQQALDGNARRHRSAGAQRLVRAPLTGKLFDAAGEPMSPTFSLGKSGRSYSYYVSAALQQGRAGDDQGRPRRLAAITIERIVSDAVGRWLGEPATSLDRVRTVRVADSGIVIDLSGSVPNIALRLAPAERLLDRTKDMLSIHLPLAWPLRGSGRIVTEGGRRTARPDPTLVATLRRAHRLAGRDRGVPFVEAAPASPYDRGILRLAFLAPDIQRDILAGHAPPDLNLERLRDLAIPLAWSEQRVALGWPPGR